MFDLDLEIKENITPFFAQLEKKLKNNSNTLSKIDDVIRKRIDENFKKNNFIPSKSAIEENRPTLIKDKTLMKSWIDKKDKNTIDEVQNGKARIGSILPYSRIMAEGGTIKAWGKTQVTFPPRNYLDLNGIEPEIQGIIIKDFEDASLE